MSTMTPLLAALRSRMVPVEADNFKAQSKLERHTKYDKAGDANSVVNLSRDASIVAVFDEQADKAAVVERNLTGKSTRGYTTYSIVGYAIIGEGEVARTQALEIIESLREAQEADADEALEGW